KKTSGATCEAATSRYGLGCSRAFLAQTSTAQNVRSTVSWRDRISGRIPQDDANRKATPSRAAIEAIGSLSRARTRDETSLYSRVPIPRRRCDGAAITWVRACRLRESALEDPTPTTAPPFSATNVVDQSPPRPDGRCSPRLIAYRLLTRSTSFRYSA